MRTKLIAGSVAVAALLFTGCAYNTFDKDTMNTSNCYGGCEKKWPVFNGNVDKMSLPHGVMASNFGTTTRKNGAMQTTYNGKPLYYFFMDKKPHDVNGDGKKGVWHIVK